MVPMRSRTKRKDGLPPTIPSTQSTKSKARLDAIFRICFNFVVLMGLFILVRGVPRYSTIRSAFFNNTYGKKAHLLEPLEIRFPDRPSCFQTALPIGEYVTEEKDDLLHGLKQREKTTVIIISSSSKKLEKTLPLYGDMNGVIDRVLVLWNNQEECPPKVPLYTKVDLFVIPQRTDSLNNRMGEDVLKYTRTRSILHATDDVFLPVRYIRYMIYTWVQNGVDSIVGDWKDRGYADPSSGAYSKFFPEKQKGSNKERRHNIVSTRSMIIGRKWVEIYAKKERVNNFVDAEANCEYIMISALIRKNTERQNPILLDIPEEHDREELAADKEVNETLNKEDEVIKKEQRDRCVQKAMAFFGNDIWDPEE